MKNKKNIIMLSLLFKVDRQVIKFPSLNSSLSSSAVSLFTGMKMGILLIGKSMMAAIKILTHRQPHRHNRTRFCNRPTILQAKAYFSRSAMFAHLLKHMWWHA